MSAPDFSGVAAAVDDVGRMLRADGGNLHLVEADPRTARVRLRLELDDVSCEECVLPPDVLFETMTHALRENIRGEFELVLDDPRRSA